jgi:hypothetical protein
MTDYTPEHRVATNPLLTNKTYDQLKKLVTIGLPAFGTFYVTVAALWSLPNPEAVAATTLALSTFLGLLLGAAGRSYVKSEAGIDGEIVVSENEDGVKVASMVLKKYENPADVVKQDKVTFAVRKQD